jgi:hypothetical protein
MLPTLQYGYWKSCESVPCHVDRSREVLGISSDEPDASQKSEAGYRQAGFFWRFCVSAQEGACVTSEKNKFTARKIANLNLLRKNAAPGAAFLRSKWTQGESHILVSRSIFGFCTRK